MAAAMAATAPAARAAQERWPGVASMLLGPSPKLGTLPGSLANATLGRSARQPGTCPRDERRSPGLEHNSSAQVILSSDLPPSTFWCSFIAPSF